MIQQTDIRRRVGDTFPESVQVISQATGEPQNLQGCTLTLRVSRGLNTETIWQADAAITSQDGGLVEFPIDADRVASIGRQHYEIKMTDSLGRIRTILQGNFIIE